VLTPDGNRTTSTYYANGLLASKVDALGNATLYAYDKANRQINLT